MKKQFEPMKSGQMHDIGLSDGSNCSALIMLKINSKGS